MEETRQIIPNTTGKREKFIDQSKRNTLRVVARHHNLLTRIIVSLLPGGAILLKEKFQKHLKIAGNFVNEKNKFFTNYRYVSTEMSL